MRLERLLKGIGEELHMKEDFEAWYAVLRDEADDMKVKGK